jgi:hypothetical protein
MLAAISISTDQYLVLAVPAAVAIAFLGLVAAWVRTRRGRRRR